MPSYLIREPQTKKKGWKTVTCINVETVKNEEKLNLVFHVEMILGSNFNFALHNPQIGIFSKCCKYLGVLDST